MARIYVVGSSPGKQLKWAIEYLRSQGNEVEVASEVDAATALIRKDAPDILVVGLWVPPSKPGWALDAFGLIQLLDKEHPGASVYKILLTVMGASGEPSRFWPKVFDAYVMPDASEWQLVLTTEQFLFRRVLPLD